MKYYVEICKTGSMAKAAENLNISQQGISNSIRKLESELGCDLFYRKRSGLVLTDTGIRFKSEAEEILKHVDRIYDLCTEKRTGKCIIPIAMTESIIVRLPDSLQQLIINGNEDYSVRLIEDYSSGCMNRVAENEAVFGIIYGDCDTSKFNVTHLDYVRQVFIANKNNVLAKLPQLELKDLDGIPMTLPDTKSYPRIAFESIMKAAGYRVNVVYECNRPRQTIGLILNNPNLISRTIYDEITSSDLENIKILDIRDFHFDLPLTLICKKGRVFTSHERLFRHLILDSF